MAKERIKFLRYTDSYRLVNRFEWDLIVVPIVSGVAVFVILALMQVPLWASPFFAGISGWKILKYYIKLIKDASPGYLYHFFYTKGLINPVVKEKKNGKTIQVNPINIPFGFENDFRD